MEETLYKRNAKGDIIKWSISDNPDGSIHIAHGVYNGKSITEDIKPTSKRVNETLSRITAKRKEGYKSLEDLYDNSPRKLDSENEYHYLQTYLPKYNTTAEGFVLPMLAKTLEDNKPFDKFGCMPGQWKINGLRCFIGAERVEGDLFKQYRFTYNSREGTRWNIPWMDEIIEKNISSYIIELMVEEGVHLDGELYLPGYTVNDINSFVKNSSLPQHYKLQYWCYDLAIENITAMKRYEILSHNSLHIPHGFTKESHLNNVAQFVTLPCYDINNISDAIAYRDSFISLGFEGLIIRNPQAEYAFGKRNSSMFKFKRKEDGLFEIVDIKEDKRKLPIFVLKNDINSELFECTLNLSQNMQKDYLEKKDSVIGKKGFVEYRERSGVKQVPFHAKLIKIII